VFDVLPALVKMNILGRVAVATRMPSMTGLSGYVLKILREGPDFTLYRGRQHGNHRVAHATEQPSPQGLRRLKHEYSLAAELEPAWAARPLAFGSLPEDTDSARLTGVSERSPTSASCRRATSS
jgi:hypothetical protein